MAELHGLKIPDLPDGVVPLRCLALIEMLTPEGDRIVQVASTDDLMTWEAAGLAVFLDHYARKQMS